MSSETITKNDLENILKGVGIGSFNTGDMRKLLWTNSSSASFAAQTIPLDLSDYDCVEVWFKEEETINSQLGSPIRTSVGKESSVVVIHSLAYAGTNENIGSRHISVSTTGVSFGNYQYKNRRSGGSLTTDNSFCIPYKIYGIKLGTGYRQNELLITDAELETLGTALGVVDKLYNILNAMVTPFGKSLWTGTWSRGEITVPGWSKYSLFLIKSTGNVSLIGYKDGTNLRGCFAAGNTSAMSHYTETFSASSNGDKLTLEYAKFLQHTASGNHNAGTSITINEIVGLVPNFGGQ